MNDTDAAFSELSEDALRGYLHEYFRHHLGFSLTLPPPPSVLYLLYPPFLTPTPIQFVQSCAHLVHCVRTVYQLGTKGR